MLMVGIDCLRGKDFDVLRGKRVGLLSHQAAVTDDGSTSAQLLHRVLGDRLVALYGPEHGFFGQAGAGEHTYTRPHPDWDIPVYSLYGEQRKPSPEMLEGVDIVVCDLQDLGVRCYTYLATLRNMLEACGEAQVEVLVADRPIPLPEIVEGPMLDPTFASFVAPAPLPMVYGMTPAEAALWMKKKLGLDDLALSVAPIEDVKRADLARSSGLDWIPPSPGIKSWEATMTYAATVFSEALPGIDCGRGTNLAFRVFGAPWIKAEECCLVLSQLPLQGVTFHPYRYTAGIAPYAGQELDGVRLCVNDPSRFLPAMTSAGILMTLTNLYGAARVWQHEGVRPEWFDKLYGGGQTREALTRSSETILTELVSVWEKDCNAFKREREEVLLYK